MSIFNNMIIHIGQATLYSFTWDVEAAILYLTKSNGKKRVS